MRQRNAQLAILRSQLVDGADQLVVLFRHYAKFLDGVREQANRLIEQSMQEWDRVSQGAESSGSASLAIATEAVTGGLPVHMAARLLGHEDLVTL
ncbi:hypothetical protein ABZ725_43260 [Streptomyces sp. NPDC006872]|uniref:hypothetical protein n=1 Tax=Streptomyces sp. NPDC006872 TaxID=3155720 RepID=UPI00340FD44A